MPYVEINYFNISLTKRKHMNNLFIVIAYKFLTGK